MTATDRDKARASLQYADHIADEAPTEQRPMIIALVGIGFAILDVADSIDRLDKP